MIYFMRVVLSLKAVWGSINFVPSHCMRAMLFLKASQKKGRGLLMRLLV